MRDFSHTEARNYHIMKEDRSELRVKSTIYS